MAGKWIYTGDINIEHGGMFYFEDGPDASPDSMSVVVVTPASDGGGMDNRFLIERGSVYMPNDDIERMNVAASICGYTVNADKSLSNQSYPDEGPFEFQSPEWRIRMLDSWKAYWGLDGADSWVVQVGTEKPDPNFRTQFLDEAEPAYQLRRNVKLYKWVEKEFCN